MKYESYRQKWEEFITSDEYSHYFNQYKRYISRGNPPNSLLKCSLIEHNLELMIRYIF
jgi:hypothetical protein